MRFAVLYKGKKVLGYVGPFRNAPEAEKWAERAVKHGGGAVTDFSLLTLSDPDQMMAEVLRTKDAAGRRRRPSPEPSFIRYQQ